MFRFYIPCGHWPHFFDVNIPFMSQDFRMQKAAFFFVQSLYFFNISPPKWLTSSKMVTILNIFIRPQAFNTFALNCLNHFFLAIGLLVEAPENWAIMGSLRIAVDYQS